MQKPPLLQQGRFAFNILFRDIRYHVVENRLYHSVTYMAVHLDNKKLENSEAATGRRQLSVEPAPAGGRRYAQSSSDDDDNNNDDDDSSSDDRAGATFGHRV